MSNQQLSQQYADYRAACISHLRRRLVEPGVLEKMPDIFLVIIDRALDMNLRELRRFANLGLGPHTEIPS